VAKIMRAKYYPDGDFLKAKMGGRPSFAWRSIHSSCDLLKEGLIWRIRNRSSMKIWKDQWLPNLNTYCVCSPITVLNEEAKVKELIDEDLKGWNVQLLQRIFSNEEAQLCQTLPLSSTNQPDVLI
jgi:hypothetical protein